MSENEIETFVAALVSGYDMEPEDAAALHEVGKQAARADREAAARQEAERLLAEARRERNGEAKRGDEAYGLLARATAERDRLRAELAALRG